MSIKEQEMELQKATQQKLDTEQIDKLGKELTKQKLKARTQQTKQGWWPKDEYERRRKAWAAYDNRRY